MSLAATCVLGIFFNQAALHVKSQSLKHGSRQNLCHRSWPRRDKTNHARYHYIICTSIACCSLGHTWAKVCKSRFMFVSFELKPSGLSHLIGHFLSVHTGTACTACTTVCRKTTLALLFSKQRSVKFIRSSGSLKHEGAATFAIPLHLANQIGQISGCEWGPKRSKHSPNTVQPSCC